MVLLVIGAGRLYSGSVDNKTDYDDGYNIQKMIKEIKMIVIYNYAAWLKTNRNVENDR